MPKRTLLVVCAVLPILLGGLWGAAALYYRAPLNELLRTAVATGFAAVSACACILAFTRQRGRALALWLASLVGLFAWWSTIQPTGQGDWAPDVARLPKILEVGDSVTVENVRAFDWTGDHSAHEFWETRHYDMLRLDTLEVFFSTWGNPAIAHTILTFGFADGRRLAFSTEVRRKKNEEYSSVAGFFKNDELAIIAADESDVIRVRTNFRGEDVHLYRIDIMPETARRVFKQYVIEVDSIAARPKFYNTLTDNCTTIPWRLSRAAGGVLPLDWRVLVSGYGPDYLYDHGFIAHELPLDQIKTRAAISDIARHAPSGVRFSAAIRAGFRDR